MARLIGQQKHVDLDDDDPSAVEHMIQFMYGRDYEYDGPLPNEPEKKVRISWKRKKEGRNAVLDDTQRMVVYKLREASKFVSIALSMRPRTVITVSTIEYQDSILSLTRGSMRHSLGY